MSNQAKKSGDPDASSEQPETVEQQSTPEMQPGSAPGAETPPEVGQAGGEESELQKLQDHVTELETENSELKDKYLRKQADFENFRKRSIREKEETVAFSNQQLLNDLVTVIDDFERAIRSAEESRDFDSFHDGIVLIEKQLVSMLERKWGLQRFESEGQEFDPQRHEAVMSEVSEEHEQPTVVEDFQKGYLLHDRVLRSAKVKVAMPS